MFAVHAVPVKLRVPSSALDELDLPRKRWHMQERSGRTHFQNFAVGSSSLFAASSPAMDTGFFKPHPGHWLLQAPPWTLASSSPALNTGFFKPHPFKRLPANAGRSGLCEGRPDKGRTILPAAQALATQKMKLSTSSTSTSSVLEDEELAFFGVSRIQYSASMCKSADIINAKITPPLNAFPPRS